MNKPIKFERDLYSPDCIKKAAYKYIDQFAIDIVKKEKFWEVVISFDLNTEEEEQQVFIDDFKKEVLDQDLRERIKKETESVRNLILAHAFSKTILIQDE